MIFYKRKICFTNTKIHIYLRTENQNVQEEFEDTKGVIKNPTTQWSKEKVQKDKQ